MALRCPSGRQGHDLNVVFTVMPKARRRRLGSRTRLIRGNCVDRLPKAALPVGLQSSRMAMRRNAPSSPDGSDICRSHADAVHAAEPGVDEANDAAGEHQPRHPPTRQRMDELDAILARLARADRRPRDFRTQDRTSHLAARVAQAIEILEPLQELLEEWTSHEARATIARLRPGPRMQGFPAIMTPGHDRHADRAGGRRRPRSTWGRASPGPDGTR